MTANISEPTDTSDRSEVEFKVRRLQRRPNTPAGQFDIKIYADDSEGVATVMNGVFIFAIPIDLNGAALARAEAYVTTSGGSDMVVQIRNVTAAVDMLSTPITIDSGDLTSYAATTPSVVDTANAGVATGNMIAIDIISDGGGALGLGVILDF